jgi:hypothetical protein
MRRAGYDHSQASRFIVDFFRSTPFVWHDPCEVQAIPN